MTDAIRSETAVSGNLAMGDGAALIGSVAILIGYAFLPLRSDGPETGLAFINSGTTFPALTLMVGVVGAVSALVSLAAIRERAARWWFVGLGLLGLIFLVDNFLREKAALASGGWLAMVGCAVLILQAALPRAGAAAENRVNNTVLGLIRVGVGTLWFTQLLWKLPWNNYGCAAGSLVPAANTSGLCDWIGREIASPRWPAYKSFLTGFVAPNLGWLAFFIVAGEAFVCVSLLLGFFTRAGGLAGTAMGINLFIGLTALAGEWDWTYLMLPAVCLVFVVVGGRWIGIDAILNPMFKKAAERGNRIARILLLFT
jgi:hypothetical protein